MDNLQYLYVMDISAKQTSHMIIMLRTKWAFGSDQNSRPSPKPDTTQVLVGLGGLARLEDRRTEKEYQLIAVF